MGGLGDDRTFPTACNLARKLSVQNRNYGIVSADRN